MYGRCCPPPDLRFACGNVSATIPQFNVSTLVLLPRPLFDYQTLATRVSLQRKLETSFPRQKEGTLFGSTRRAAEAPQKPHRSHIEAPHPAECHLADPHKPLCDQYAASRQGIGCFAGQGILLSQAAFICADRSSRICL